MFLRNFFFKYFFYTVFIFSLSFPLATSLSNRESKRFTQRVSETGNPFVNTFHAGHVKKTVCLFVYTVLLYIVVIFLQMFSIFSSAVKFQYLIQLLVKSNNVHVIVFQCLYSEEFKVLVINIF